MLPTQSAQALTNYFKNCSDEMVWVRARQPQDQRGIVQHAMTFMDGGSAYRCPPIPVGEPFLITSHVPLDVLKKSADFRNSVLRGALELLTTDEAHAVFARKANALGRSADALKAEAEARAQEYLNHQPLRDKSVPLDPNARAMDTIQRSVTAARTYESAPIMEDRVKPHVIHICQQASPLLDESECMPAKEMIAKFEDIVETLNYDDLEHIYAHGRWKSVTQWAAARKRDLAKTFEIDDVAPAAPAAPTQVTSI